MSESTRLRLEGAAKQTNPAPARPRSRFFTRLRRKRSAVAGAGLLGMISLAAILAPWLAPHDPLQQDLRNILQGPSGSHWLGTDELGRDVLSRVLYGGRVSLPSALLAVGVAVAIGVPAGLIMGYRRGWWDRIGMRLTDAFMAVPGIILAIGLIAVLGNSPINAMAALGFVFSRSYVRLARAETLAVSRESYVEAARLSNYPTWRILGRHVLPNILPTLVVQSFLTLGFALLAEAGLSFIGLGTKPPFPSWGAMLSDAAAYISYASSLVFPPGAAIALTVLGANLLGDGVRDSLGSGIEQGYVTFGGRRGDDGPAMVRSDVGEEAPLLDVHDLTVGYGRNGEEISVVDGVSLAVSSGETLALVGESGSGKSVTALAIMQLLGAPLRIREGSVSVDGVALSKCSRKDLNKMRGSVMSMVFQEPLASLNPSMTVGRQLMETIRRHRASTAAETRRLAIAALERVEINDAEARMRAYPHELSGGMAQRVMIAMATVAEPKLVFADEPTTALDVTVEVEILDLLHRLRSELGAGILFITHDMSVVADIADRVAVMYAGHIVEEASVAELFATPRHPYTSALLASLPARHPRGGDLPSIPGSVPDPGARPIGCRFAERCPNRKPECDQPQELRILEGGHSVRCVLVDSSTVKEVT